MIEIDEITVKCALLEKMVGAFNSSVSDYKSSEYEAHEEALNLMKLTGVTGFKDASLRYLSGQFILRADREGRPDAAMHGP